MRLNLRKTGIIIFALVLFGCVGVLSSQQVKGAESYVTDICIKAGNDAQDKIKMDHYTLLNQCFNMGEWQKNKSDLVDGKALVYMGYRLSTNESFAITNLMVVKEKEAKKKIEEKGITYTLVSDVSLNQGVDGDTLYLYYTKNKKAGSPIVDFDISFYQKGNTDDFSGLALLNDGSVPVRTLEGDCANLDAGREGIELYLFMIHNDMCQPYISKVEIGEASSKRGVIKKLAKAGCDYYVNGNRSGKSDSYEMIGYQRTDSKKKALLVTNSKDKKQVKLEAAGSGNYLNHILPSYDGEKAELTAAECAGICFDTGTGVARIFLMQEKAYTKWIQEKTNYTKKNVSLLMDQEKALSVALLYETKTVEVEKKEEPVATKEVTPSATPTAPVTEATGAANSNGEAVSGASASTTGTALSTGNVVIILGCIVVILILAGTGVYFVKKRRR